MCGDDGQFGELAGRGFQDAAEVVPQPCGDLRDEEANAATSGGASKSDAVENRDVVWVPRNSAIRVIDADTLYPSVLAALKEQT
ncbi:hypothetical protein [Kitasatospora viridis]|uniref:hypothetical protein n=1 Tax=Kitasatospora viridis TaxID=281105 RepID=UPI001478C3E2|nr:hypothetical protein [Kitasatospora viridis]